uniref:Uncharacterized protein n=1 Tax=Aegilops tauschii subsp. strangulata TaxID=200361 RepID=A0A453SBP6_AEGTS
GSISRGGESASGAPPCSGRKNEPLGPEAKQHFVSARAPEEEDRGGGERERESARARERRKNMFIQKAWRTAAFGLYGFTQFTKSGFVEHAKKFREEDMQIRLDGKNCLVTGANSGLGYATAQGLASHGATVYMLCRNKERGETALNEIRSKTGNMNVHLEICDLSSINEVKSFATKFSSLEKPLHVLVNNAGLLEHKRTTTPEGCWSSILL